MGFLSIHHRQPLPAIFFISYFIHPFLTALRLRQDERRSGDAHIPNNQLTTIQTIPLPIFQPAPFSLDLHREHSLVFSASVEIFVTELQVKKSQTEKQANVTTNLQDSHLLSLEHSSIKIALYSLDA